MTEFGSEIGQVLFFDHKKGWGFIKIIKSSNEYEGKDIFTHFSSINCVNEFKKIHPGEYVSLDVEENPGEKDDSKKLQSKNVTGLFGNQLLIDNKDHIYRVIKKRI